MEPIIEQDQSKPKSVDRVTLGAAEKEKLEKWLIQMNSFSKGFLELTRADMVNFLIREHREELTTKELNQLRSDNYDPVKHINWILPKLKEALSSRDTAQVALLQAELRGIELSIVNKAMDAPNTDSVDTPKPKRKSKKSKQDETINSASFAEDISHSS